MTLLAAWWKMDETDRATVDGRDGWWKMDETDRATVDGRDVRDGSCHGRLAEAWNPSARHVGRLHSSRVREYCIDKL